MTESPKKPDIGESFMIAIEKGEPNHLVFVKGIFKIREQLLQEGPEIIKRNINSILEGYCNVAYIHLLLTLSAGFLNSDKFKLYQDITRLLAVIETGLMKLAASIQCDLRAQNLNDDA